MKYSLLYRVLGTAFCMAFFSQAKAYEQFNTEFSFEHYSRDYSGQDEIKMNSVTGTVYVSPVRTENKPFAEAAFLEQTGTYSFALIKEEDKLGSNVSISNPGFAIHVDRRQNNDPFTFSALYFNTASKVTISATTPIVINSDVKGAGLGFGFYIKPGFHVEFDHLGLSSSSDYLLADTTMKDNQLHAKLVQQLHSNNTYNLEATIGSTSFEGGTLLKQKNDYYKLTGDYYFTNAFSLGAGLNINKGDDSSEEGRTSMVRGQYFLNPYISLAIQSTHFDAKNSGEDSSTAVDFTVTVRH